MHRRYFGRCFFVDLAVARTIIHIGMPRTASTFLQKAVFPGATDFLYIGPEETQYSVHFQRLLYQDDTLWDGAAFAAAFAERHGSNLLLSNELFAGQGLYLSATNRTRTAQRLAQAFPDAAIVLVLRHPVTLLQSLYTLGVYSGFTMGPEEFVHLQGMTSTSRHPLYPTFAPGETTEVYRFAPLIRLYKSLFARVHVYFFEDFTTDPGAFIQRMSHDLNMVFRQQPDYRQRQNRSLSATQVKLLRMLHLWKPLLCSTRAGTALYRMKLRWIEKAFAGGRGYVFPEALRMAILKETEDDVAEVAAMLSRSESISPKQG